MKRIRTTICIADYQVLVVALENRLIQSNSIEEKAKIMQSLKYYYSKIMRAPQVNTVLIESKMNYDNKNKKDLLPRAV